MFKAEHINYTAYLKNKPQEKDPTKLAAMMNALAAALKGRCVRGHISAKYYQDGNVLVHVNGEYYGVFNSTTGEFFSGYVGD